MFGIDFSELLLIGIVALVVLGPERLPRVARTAGLLFGRMQRYVADVKADINREIHAEELRKLEGEMRASVSALEQSVSKEVHAATEQIHEIVEVAPTQTLAQVPPPDEEPQPQLALNLDGHVSPSPATPEKNS
jgi:sec-independent protein translocase protein TatB